MTDIWAVVEAERQRAHRKHGPTSMESLPVDDLTRLTVLMEEVGEVAREFNEARHRGDGPDLLALGTELVQVAAMAGAWADTCAAALRSADVQSPMSRRRALDAEVAGKAGESTVGESS